MLGITPVRELGQARTRWRARSGTVRLDRVLVAKDIEKAYGDVVALRGTDLSVAAGEVVALLGRNGAGKSTLLSIIAGLRPPDAGSVEIHGIDALADPVAASQHLGIAPQDTGVYRVLTVRENLEFFGELAGLKATRSARAEAVAEQLGLTDLLDRKASALSGGEVRRLHTGCALVHAPELLMLDEPTVGADVATRNQLIEAVRALAADGAAVIYTTHYLPEVTQLGADIVIIDDGRILARGTQAELEADHAISGLAVEVTADFDRARLDTFRPVDLGGGRLRLDGAATMAGVLEAAGDQTSSILSVERLQADLESVFLAVTGRQLDDETEVVA